MKKQPVTLAVPSPCHENWQQMTPTEQGRFCNSCQKTVHDFTIKTDREVARYFEQQLSSPNSGSSCGRFRPDQLHRPLHVERPDGWGIRLRTLGLVLSGLLMSSWAQAQSRPQLKGKVACASPTPPDTVIVEKRPVIMGKMAMPKPETQGEVAFDNPVTPVLLQGDTVIAEQPKFRTITGKLVDADTNEPLAFASVYLKGREIGTTTNLDGEYKLQFRFLPDSLTLAFSLVGYEEVMQKISPTQNKVDLRMKPQKMEMMVMGIVVKPEKQAAQDIAKQPKPVLPKLPHPAELEAIAVEAFPNPFSRMLNIRFDSPVAEHLSIRLTDMQGRTVLLQTYEAMKGPQLVALDNLGADNLPSGQYLLELSSPVALRYAGLVMKE